MKRAKTIDEIYDEVRDYDLVITNDAALATALNSRIDRPFIGYFATTPKMLASNLGPEILGEGIHKELRVIGEICDETGYQFKFVHGEVRNIKEIRKYTARVSDHMHTKRSRRIFDSFDSLPTLERAMSSFDTESSDFFKDRPRVAVIGIDLFNDLDKHFVPWEHDEIDPFTEDRFTIERIYEIGNDRQVAENAVDLIDPEHAEDYAIILDTSSPMTDAVRASLYRKGIPFVNNLNVRDLTQIRDYLQFLRLSLQYPTLRVKHVKELFSNYNGSIRPGREEFLLLKQDKDHMSSKAWVMNEAMRSIEDLTFDDVVGILDNPGTVQIRMLLGDMGLINEKVTATAVSDLVYAVDNVEDLRHNEEIPVNERTGVLITDCRRSVYVDRPVTIFLGMEQDWNITVVGKNYLDIEEETEKNVMKLEILLQQGSRRIYCVNTTKHGRPAKPSMLFDLIMRRPANTFADICDELVPARWCDDTDPILPDRGSTNIDSDREFCEPFSKSSFNAYYSCPRAYMFKSLLHTPDEKTTEFGNLIHAFAELYVCYPEIVRDMGVDSFVDMISDRYSGLSSPALRDLDRDSIALAMSSVMGFLDDLGVRDAPLDVPLSSKSHPNEFMSRLGLDRTSSLCEMDRMALSKHMHGPFDLYWNGVVVDYKTGKPKDVREIVDAMTWDSGSMYPEFQPLIYLAISKERPSSCGLFRLFYAMDNDVDIALGGSDMMRNVRDIRCTESDLKGILTGDPRIREELSSSLSKNYRDHVPEILEMIGEMGSDDVMSWDKDEGMIGAITDACGLNRNKTNLINTERAVRKITRYVRSGTVCVGNTVIVPETVLSGFVSSLDEMHRTAMEQMNTVMPAQPRIQCEKCGFRSVCTGEVIRMSEGSYESDE